ncbi:metal ABC transporter permease [Thaumasiovibrio subtropicus]|uniref:metal ABC transporter permease n=1 Tax=Thaumasiovibrio subtropicus TaxID=1891207 RepID=UPI000B357A94|nr:metal ABC transporter permease [Thaumasiovibrio subtropicus]
MNEWLITPFSFPFMQDALIAAIATAIVCALLSCYLVLKGWAMMGDAISHAVLPGVVLAAVLGIPLAIGAVLSGLSCALLTGFVKNHSRIKEDTAMGIMFTGLFSLGLILFSVIDTDQHLQHILFGNLMGIPAKTLLTVILTAVVTVLIIALKGKDIMCWCFDNVHAKSIGLNTSLLHYGFLVILASAIVAAMQAVGVVLVVAMLVAPGLTAQLLCRRFASMQFIAVSSAIIAVTLGIVLSFHLDAATGPTIVLVQTALFCLALGYQRLSLSGILIKLLEKKSLTHGQARNQQSKQSKSEYKLG